MPAITRTTWKSQARRPLQRAAPPPRPSPRPPPPPPPPPPRSRRALTLITALTFTASLGGVYLYRRMAQDDDEVIDKKAEGSQESENVEEEEPYPALEADMPERVQYLLVGGGTASFAAMRAIRSARPDASVLIVSEERALPYMRPPLSKELWREPELARRAADPAALTFRQWNGRRRSVAYEPAAFYAPVERLRDGAGGAAVARGWRVLRVDVARREAELAAGERRARVAFEQCLLAPGVRARRLPALAPAAAAGRALAVRDLADVARLARALEEPGVRTVAVVGAGLLGAELSAALADRLRESGARVVALYREAAPLAALLPPYLAAHAARTLAALGVTLLPHSEVVGCSAGPAGVRLRLRAGGAAAELDAQLVVECVGAAPDERLARASRLETHAALGGLLVNAELQARAGVWAAGDAACFHDELLGRRRVEHHDHAVASGRLAGENMAGLRPPRAYSHQSMFWSDLGPSLGYEAIGIIDSSLETVGVFCEDAVSDASSAAQAVGAPSEGAAGGAPAGAPGEGALPDTRALLAPGDEAGGKRYERGVVFYLRERRVVGVLLWNLFNRMHVARQVLAQGEFDDLFEVAKLFSLHEDD
ncbi:putative apoptosis-inducing factor 1, mitochondrial [Colias croceus]|uniref:putative apoptosis-inducing factor 1, mitochondrial n=1 Tax=Colias crocea TaxID=72248 RepID=UPI001E27B141|nr:putative apoptosis-inducing factor 1, mitochondrial [Colias croceus]XP_045504590.1 putative apoptosis-inducing factor 1, mitochondrial [Colias croceus]